MGSDQNDEPPPKKIRIKTATYRSSDRRAPRDIARSDTTSIHSVIRFDELGNAAWDFAPVRDLRLSTESNAWQSPIWLRDGSQSTEDTPAGGYDPYARGGARIVERHDGRTWTHGELGVGATFYFTFQPSVPAT